MGDLKEGNFVKRKDGTEFSGFDLSKSMYGKVQYFIPGTDDLFVNLVNSSGVLIDLINAPSQKVALNDIELAPDVETAAAVIKTENERKAREAYDEQVKTIHDGLKAGRKLIFTEYYQHDPPVNHVVSFIKYEYPYFTINHKGAEKKVIVTALKLGAVGGARKQKRKTIRRKRTKGRTYRRS